MKTRVPNGDWPSWAACVRILVTAVLIYLCIRYWGSFTAAVRLLCFGLAAVFAGFCIAYVLNLPMRFYERLLRARGLGDKARAIALLLAVITIVGVVIALILLVLPQFIRCMITFAEGAPALVEALLENPVIASAIPAQVMDQFHDIQWGSLMQRAFEWAQAGAASLFPGVMSAVASVGTFGVGCVFAIWFLIEKESLSSVGHRLVRAYIGPVADGRLVRLSALLDDCFGGYIKAQSCESLILGSLVTIGSMLLGLPYASMVGPLIALMSFIPMVGAFIGMVIGALMIASVSWQQAIVFVVLVVAIQQVEANVIYPRVVGRMVGLSGFWTLFGLTLGAGVAGMPGAFVAVPVTAAVTRLVGQNMQYREQSDEDVPIEQIVGQVFEMARGGEKEPQD